MTFFGWLFGSRRISAPVARPVTQPTAVRRKVTFEHGFARIDSLNFYGEFARSPNKEYVLCWSDTDPSGSRGGHRYEGMGRYVLYHALIDTIAVQGQLERPNDGKVADTGAFCLADWHFGDDLSGTFHVFDASGAERVRRRFEANLVNCAISPQGRFAVCQTAINSGHDDGDLLAAFDVERGEQLYGVHPSTGWAKSYRFDEANGALTVQIEGIGSFRYDAKGVFLDARKFDLACLKSGQFERVLYTSERILRRPELDEAMARTVLDSAQLLCATGHEDPRWQATAWKVCGKANEFLQREVDALAAYEKALQFDPKVGVKRAADTLRKKLKGPPSTGSSS